MSSIYSIRLEELNYWVRNKADYGDIAYAIDRAAEKSYIYFFIGPDENPYWREVNEAAVSRYLEKEHEGKDKVNKRCDNCEYFNKVSGNNNTFSSWCSHEEHKGMIVPNFTSCPEYEEKENKSTPFDGIKFYLKDATTGELSIKYICEDCGKEMNEPDHWWMKVPYGNAIPKDLGFHYRCQKCDEKKEGKTW